MWYIRFRYIKLCCIISFVIADFIISNLGFHISFQFWLHQIPLYKICYKNSQLTIISDSTIWNMLNPSLWLYQILFYQTMLYYITISVSHFCVIRFYCIKFVVQGISDIMTSSLWQIFDIMTILGIPDSKCHFTT